jgi:hypothetical protein
VLSPHIDTQTSSDEESEAEVEEEEEESDDEFCDRTTAPGRRSCKRHVVLWK